MTAGFIWHELFAWHDAGHYTSPAVEPMSVPDSPEPKRRIRNLLDVSGLLQKLVEIRPEEATDEQLSRVHDPHYVRRVRAVGEAGGGELTRFAHIGPKGDRIARCAAGAAITGVDALLGGAVDSAYALIRPAGHHAGRSGGGGFCIFNNVAIGAMHALSVHGLKRIAIVDWDVHHGNGTQEIFWEDGRVLAISIHQEMLHAGGGGAVEELGSGEGLGTTLNVPLPPGSGEGAYFAVMDELVIPALERFRPELIIVASGLDAGSHDALGRMLLHSGSFRQLTRMIKEAAARVCPGRLLFCHEGGYSAAVAPFAGLAIMEELSESRTDIEDPFLPNAARQPGQKIRPHQREVIEKAKSNLKLVPQH